MARPDTRKISGLKKKERKKENVGPRRRDGKARYTENGRTKKQTNKEMNKKNKNTNGAVTHFFFQFTT